MAQRALQQKWPTAIVVVLVAGTLALSAALSTGHFGGAVTRATAATKPSGSWARELSFLHPGDLVFRRGESVLSAAVMVLDPRSLYSHVGIVVETAGRLSVVHAVVDEAPDTAGSVRADSIPDFLSPDRAAAVAVYRLRGEIPEYNERTELASRIAAGYASRHVPFDRDFDLGTADAVYCTELIWRAYRGAGIELVSGELPTISFCLKRRRAILPSTLQNSAKLRLIWQTSERN